MQNSLKPETVEPFQYPAKASKRLIQAIQAFGLNAFVAAITISTNKLIEPQYTLYLAYVWIATTVLYGVACGAFFYQFGRLKSLWGVVIVVTQPIGIIVSIIFLVRRGIKYGWYRNKMQDNRQL